MPGLNDPAAARDVPRPPVSSTARATPLLMACAALLVMVVPALGQNQYTYISSPTPQTISGFVVDTVKVPGSLALVSGSPFPESLDPEQMAIHPSGEFLFVVNSSSGTSKEIGRAHV